MSSRAPRVGGAGRRRDVLSRRAASIGGVALVAATLTVGFVPLVGVAALVDLVRLRTRLPIARLLCFGLCWAWLELAGVAAAAGLWLTFRARDLDVHYRLQRWWADRLLAALRVTCGVSLQVEGIEALRPTPTVLLVRHASLADSLLTAWVVAQQAGLHPRVVLKRELLADPCLDIVGNRLPNCFLDRQAEDSTPGLAAVEHMAATMAPEDVSIIFPEGTRANDAKRRRALERITERDPARAARLAGLDHLLPPRPAGTRALLQGAARGAGPGGTTEVVVGWHAGFDGLDTFTGILRQLGRPATTVRMRLERVDGPSALDAGTVERWLDELWLRADAEVDLLLNRR